MTDFRSPAADYLATRRAMGYKLSYQGQMLGQFVDYLEGAGAEHLTITRALAWAKQPPDAAPVWWAPRSRRSAYSRSPATGSCRTFIRTRTSAGSSRRLVGFTRNIEPTPTRR